MQIITREVEVFGKIGIMKRYILTANEIKSYETACQLFYDKFGSDLDMRIEPYEVDNQQ